MLVTHKSPYRWWLISAGIGVVLYCLVVVYVVATSADLGLRWLLVDPMTAVASGDPSQPRGVTIRQLAAPRSPGRLPSPGDTLLRLDDRPLQTALDAAQAMLQLGRMPPDAAGQRWATIHYRAQATGQVEQTQLLIQPVPLVEIGLTVIWFLLQICILAVGAVAFWRRPYDRPARLFFAMCVLTLGAFVGGFHWWVLAGSLWLTLPFVLCAVLVPVVTLHFFLIYPRPKILMAQWPIATKLALYGLPLLAMVGFIVCELGIWWPWQPDANDLARTLGWLRWLRNGIYAYLLIAAGYFGATLLTLIHSVLTTRNVLERQQVTSILRAGLVATGCIGYTLMLAYWDRVSFALGGARLPMFFASLVFMVAYAVSIVRYKLMLSDEWVGRGLRTEVSRLASALACAVVVVGLGVLAGRSTSHLTGWQVGLASIVLLIIAAALHFSRDVWQRWIERRLFREKYRLEKALQRINRSVGQLADPQFLSERTLSACREVLQAEWAGLYLRDRTTGEVFRLAAVEGAVQSLPLEWAVPASFLQALGPEAVIAAALSDHGEHALALRQGLETLSADLVQLLEIDGEPAGAVVLGPKASGGMYSLEDGTFLTALTQVTGVALHCVRVHQDLTSLNEQLRLKVDRISQQKQQILLLQQELATSRTPEAATSETEFRRNAIKGSSPAIRQVLDTARKAAATEATVLLRGESGTGKELFARAIHDNSPRRAGPLVAVHCAALAPSLLESELFGHVRGAFTGATADKPGRFELARGGTLFLDEVGEISLETQVKLLRAIQQREIEPVGGQQPVSVDVRLIAATHRDLEAMIAQGRFREDLYYRLNVISIGLPPLRERPEDLYELAVEFLKRSSARCDKQVVDFEDHAWERLLGHGWPGNIRELENVIERAVVMTEGNVITVADLPAGLSGSKEAVAARPTGASRRSAAHTATLTAVTNWRRLDADEERRLLLDALQQADGNKALAAKLLGLPRSTFFSKLKKYSLAD